MTAGTRGAEPLTLKSGTSGDAWRRCRTVAPEAFRDDRVLNLWDAGWRADGRVLPATSPVDGTPITGPPRIDAATAQHAVRASLTSTGPGATSPCPERRARFGHPRRPRPAPRTARAAAGLGDRQALAVRAGRRRPRRRRCALVRRRHRGHARRACSAGRPGLQHRELELPDQRARSRIARPSTGGQRGHRQDPDRRRRRLPHPGLRARRPRGTSRHPRQRQRRRAVPGTGARPRDRLRLLRRWPGRGRRRRHRRRRPRQAAHPRTGGTQHLGHLELHGLGHARAGGPEAFRLRQATAAPPTRGSSSSGSRSTRSSRRTSRPCAPCASGTRSPSPRRTPPFRRWTSGR
ncbi:hypothetical protein STENM327S_08042 [Streptomyces tendae]